MAKTYDGTSTNSNLKTLAVLARCLGSTNEQQLWFCWLRGRRGFGAAGSGPTEQHPSALTVKATEKGP
jgi:hypothetical protein